jgi:hypothetical protein
MVCGGFYCGTGLGAREFWAAPPKSKARVSQYAIRFIHIPSQDQAPRVRHARVSAACAQRVQTTDVKPAHGTPALTATVHTLPSPMTKVGSTSAVFH